MLALSQLVLQLPQSTPIDFRKFESSASRLRIFAFAVASFSAKSFLKMVQSVLQLFNSLLGFSILRLSASVNLQQLD